MLHEPEPKKYYPKNIHITVRVDPITKYVLDKVSEQLETKVSNVIRGAIWLTFIILDPKTTLRSLLKEEAIEKLVKGEDMPFIDAIKSIKEIIEKLKIIDLES